MHRLDSRFDSEFGTALLAFNEEASVYSRGISGSVAREYAIDYARMLQNRAKRIETNQPRIPTGLFEPDGHLIRSTLEKMYRKYFPKPKSASANR